MDRQNNRPIPEFEGYSPNEMQHLIYDPFGPDSPLQLNVLEEADYRSIPMLNLIRYLGTHLKKAGEMKLTAKGFLQVKIVADLYEPEQAGQTGFAFSLILLRIYGDTKRHDTFYAHKYYRAFPDLYEGEDPETEIEENPWNPAGRCYYIRTFERFLQLIGLVDIEKEKKVMNEQWTPEKHHIRYTPLFNRLVSC